MADDRRSLPFRQSLDARAAARAAELGDNWEHMGEDARQALRQWIQAEDATEDLPAETPAAADNAELEKLRQTYDRVSDTELRATAEKMKRLEDELLVSKLRNIISGYRINEDDAGWLMGLLGRPRATAPAASAVALDWTDEQCAEFMRVALRHVEYRRGTPPPRIAEIRQGAARAAALALQPGQQGGKP